MCTFDLGLGTCSFLVWGRCPLNCVLFSYYMYSLLFHWLIMLFFPKGVKDYASGQLERLSTERLQEEEKEDGWYWWTQTSKVKARETITTHRDTRTLTNVGDINFTSFMFINNYEFMITMLLHACVQMHDHTK